METYLTHLYDDSIFTRGMQMNKSITQGSFMVNVHGKTASQKKAEVFMPHRIILKIFSNLPQKTSLIILLSKDFPQIAVQVKKRMKPP